MIREIVEMLWEEAEDPVALSFSSTAAKVAFIHSYGYGSKYLSWDATYMGLPIFVDRDQEDIVRFIEREDDSNNAGIGLWIEDDTVFVFANGGQEDEIVVSFGLDDVIDTINEYLE